MANEPTKVECSLVLAQNALINQSRADLRGVSHPDGWGIGVYEDSLPLVERRASPAFEDLHFSVIAERVFAKTVIAHVRLSTVGGALIGNTHPFTYGRWTFAHNGTVREFSELRARLERETDPRFRPLRRGETDSEQAFHWMLTRLERAGIDLAAPVANGGRLVELVSEAVRTLAGYSTATGPRKPAELNFLLTDGTVLVASCWRHSLHLLERIGVHDCEICGIPHVQHLDSTTYRATIIASEPISSERWSVVPDESVVLVDSRIEPQIVAIRS